MRFRLFKPGPRAQLVAVSLATAHWLALGAAGCAGKKFAAHEGPSASGSSGAGVSGGNDSSGDAGEGGSAEVGGSGEPAGGRGGESASAGSAGKASGGCDCSAGEYCQDGANKCRKCTDFSRLEFGAPQKLTTLAQSLQSVERFPRSAGTSSTLFYVSGAADASKILYAASPVSGAGVPVSTAGQPESGPLFVSGLAEQNLFFDRRQAGARKLWMALWTGAARTNDVQVPGQINAAGSEDYSIAISPNTGHVYWMSTRSGEPELVWQPTSMSAPPAPAVLDLKLKVGNAECARSGDDATPWVNVGGTLLLFSNASLDGDCKANDGGATDLFAAPLGKDGLPLAAATALSSLNNTGGMSQETDPSLSPDACAIYFASDNGTGDFDLYKAPRN